MVQKYEDVSTALDKDYLNIARDYCDVCLNFFE